MARVWIKKNDDGRGPYRSIPVVVRDGVLSMGNIYRNEGDDLTPAQMIDLFNLCQINNWHIDKVV